MGLDQVAIMDLQGEIIDCTLIKAPIIVSPFTQDDVALVDVLLLVGHLVDLVVLDGAQLGGDDVWHHERRRTAELVVVLVNLNIGR